MKKLASTGLALVALVVTLGWSAARAADQTGTGTPCPWKLSQLNGTTVLFGDTNGWYWRSTFSLRAAATTELLIRGEYPRARYFSVQGYDRQGRPVDALFDQEIEPDPGSANPFLAGADRDATPRNWTVRLKFTRRPAVREPNTLYLGIDANGLPSRSGSYVYRIYFPDEGQDPRGGVMAPEVFAEAKDGSAARCPSQRTRTLLNPGEWRVPPYTDPISWKPFPVESVVPNSDASYLVATFYFAEFDPMVVIRFRRPTFPDTYTGEAVRNDRDMRYFSLSLASRAGTVITSLPDSLMSFAPNGETTIVVSPPAQKPSPGALAREHATWLDASALGGPVGGEGRLVYRNLLPHPLFSHAVSDVPPDASPEQVAETMGVYYPAANYCIRAAFEANGCRN